MSGGVGGRGLVTPSYPIKLAKRWKLINEKLEFCGRTSSNALKEGTGLFSKNAEQLF